MNNEKEPLDLIDFLALAAGAAYPPLLLVAFTQWYLRRNERARTWFLKKIHQLGDKGPKRYIEANKPMSHETAPVLQPTVQLPTHNAKTPMINFDTLTRGDNILIVGGKGTGKTTILEALITTRQGSAIVLDPHATPKQWPGASEVVGKGRDYQSVTKTLISVHDWMNTRYKDRSEGRISFDQLTLFSDELRSITQHVQDAGSTLTALLTEGRKVRLCCILASHNDTGASLGVKGDKEAFISSFDWIVYTGAFATKRLNLLEIPSIQHATGAMPAYAYCFNVNEQCGYALDLRSFSNIPDQSETTLDQSETGLDHTNEDLLASLLCGGLMQSNELDQTDHFQSGDQAETTVDQAETNGEDVIQRQIREKIEKGMSKNEIFEWLRKEGITRSKGNALKMINQAITTERSQGSLTFGTNT